MEDDTKLIAYCVDMLSVKNADVFYVGSNVEATKIKKFLCFDKKATEENVTIIVIF